MSLWDVALVDARGLGRALGWWVPAKTNHNWFYIFKTCIIYDFGRILNSLAILSIHPQNCILLYPLVSYFFQISWTFFVAILCLLDPKNTNEKNVCMWRFGWVYFIYLNFQRFSSNLTRVLIRVIPCTIYFFLIATCHFLGGAENSKNDICT